MGGPLLAAYWNEAWKIPLSNPLVCNFTLTWDSRQDLEVFDGGIPPQKIYYAI